MSTKSASRADNIKDALSELSDQLLDNFIYVVPLKHWLHWNDLYWVPGNEEFSHLAERVFKKANIGYDVDRKSVLSAAQSKYAVYDTDIDSSHLLVVKNGVIDFKAFSKHKPKSGEKAVSILNDAALYKKKYLTMCMNASYQTENKTEPEHYKKLIDNNLAGDQECAAFFHLMDVGFLIGGNPLDRFFIYWGPGRNGKTVSLNIKRALLGSYSGTLSPYTLRARSQEYLNDLYRNRNKRLLIVDEFNQSTKLDTSLMKRISGRNRFPLPKTINGESDYTINFKVIFDTNHLPQVSSSEADGFWERVMVFPFQDTIPRENRDLRIEKRIIDNELDAILTFLIDNFAQAYIAATNLFSSRQKSTKDGSELPLPKRASVALRYYHFVINPYLYFIEQRCAKLPAGMTDTYKVEKRESFSVFFYQYMRIVVRQVLNELKWSEKHEYDLTNQIRCQEREFFRQLESRGHYASISKGRMIWQNTFFKLDGIHSTYYDFVPYAGSFFEDDINENSYYKTTDAEKAYENMRLETFKSASELMKNFMAAQKQMQLNEQKRKEEEAKKKENAQPDNKPEELDTAPSQTGDIEITREDIMRQRAKYNEDPEYYI